MSIFLMVIGMLMLVDGLFTLCNLDLVKRKISEFMPNMDLKTFAMAEALIGVSVIVSGWYNYNR